MGRYVRRRACKHRQQGRFYEGSSVTGLTSHATDGDKDKARVAARSYFNGNESPTHGGGILANGYLGLQAIRLYTITIRVMTMLMQ